ncbi:Stage V sporulation protein B [bioreactor metagenome]|uniref:Stage V sporulation protein B n=1 Tax=bioreactor metagenome TaxID=1076179 RepID=A0A644XSF6_9ZZZZ
MSNTSKSGTFFGGAAILASGIVIVKLIGALFKIPVGNILGDEGFGNFSNAYTIYNLLLMVSTAGLPLALSKTISEASTQGRHNQVRRIFNVSLVSFFILGTVTFAVMFFFAEPLSAFQGNSSAFYAVRTLAPACFFVCIISAFRGYAQGHSNMVPTSVSQIIEALGKLIIGLLLAWYLMRIGAGSAKAAAGAIFGVTAGAGIALVFLIVQHFSARRRDHRVARDTPDAAGTILLRLLAIAVPITIGASVVPVTTWLDTYQVQNILRDVMHAENAQWYLQNGMVDPVVSAYGAYQKAINVFNLPSSFMVALTASMIPAISACCARKDRRGAGQIAESSLRMGALLAFPAGVGLFVLAAPVMMLLAPSTDHTVADPCMAVLGVASIFVCIMFLCNAILQANGFVNLPIFIMAAGCIVKLTVNNFLVRQEGVGITGAPVGTLACYILVAVLELIVIKRVVPYPPKYRRVFLKPLISALVMGGAVWAVYGLLKGLLGLGNSLATMGSIAVGGTIYLVLVVALGAISREDLSLMPKGEKIARLLHVR